MNELQEKVLEYIVGLDEGPDALRLLQEENALAEGQDIEATADRVEQVIAEGQAEYDWCESGIEHFRAQMGDLLKPQGTIDPTKRRILVTLEVVQAISPRMGTPYGTPCGTIGAIKRAVERMGNVESVKDREVEVFPYDPADN